MVFFWYKSVDARCFIHDGKKSARLQCGRHCVVTVCFRFGCVLLRFGIILRCIPSQWTFFLRLEWIFFLPCIIKNWTKQNKTKNRSKNFKLSHSNRNRLRYSTSGTPLNFAIIVTKTETKTKNPYVYSVLISEMEHRATYILNHENLHILNVI